MSKSIQKGYRTDESLYANVENIFSQMGMSVSQAINMFFKRVEMEQQLPFQPGIVKSKSQIDAEHRIEEMSMQKIPKIVNFETGENVKEFFDE